MYDKFARGLQDDRAVEMVKVVLKDPAHTWYIRMK